MIDLNLISKIIEFENVPSILLNEKNSIILSNRSFNQMFKLSGSNDFIGMNISEVPNLKPVLGDISTLLEKRIQNSKTTVHMERSNVSEGTLFCVTLNPQNSDESLFLLKFLPADNHAEILSKLTESEIRFQNMADSSPVLLWMAREDSLCTFFNQTWLNFSGRTLEQEWGVGWAEGVHPIDFQRAMDHYQISFGKREPFEMVYRLMRWDKTYRWILDRGVPRFDRDGHFSGFIGSCVDITEQVNAKDELEIRNRQLVALNRDIEQFSYLAAHDLREPINRLSVISNLFVDDFGDSIPEEGKKLLENIKKETSSALRLINAFRYLTGMDHGELSTPTSVNLKEMIESILRNWEDRIREKEVKISFQDLPTVVMTQELAEPLYTNLISNALQYGSKGTELIFTCKKNADNKTVLGVKNTGLQQVDGSTKNQLFLPFKSSHLKPENMGLGLYICKKIVEARNGEIWIENGPEFFQVLFTL